VNPEGMMTPETEWFLKEWKAVIIKVNQANSGADVFFYRVVNNDGHQTFSNIRFD
jgi:hypothetical protein